MAAKVLDLLVRSSSMRLERLSHWVGWMAGDTSSAMAQTAGGRAVSLLCLGLVELYQQVESGVILYKVSSSILPEHQHHASMLQLGRVAQNLADKLTPLAFGSHLASQVTRIRQTYFYAGLPCPATLLEKLTVETMAELLSALQSALHDEASLLYIEGFHGLGAAVALIMALCPNDVLLMVEMRSFFRVSGVLSSSPSSRKVKQSLALKQ